MAESPDTALTGINAAYLEAIVAQYLDDPSSVDQSWRDYFVGEGRHYVAGPAPTAGPSFTPSTIFDPPQHATNGVAPAFLIGTDMLAAQVRIGQLITAYRSYGHMKAQLDPLGIWDRKAPAELDIRHWGFTEADLDRTYSTAGLHGVDSMTLREAVAFLDETYCRSIGVEFRHIRDREVQEWLHERIEKNCNHVELDNDTQQFIFGKLSEAAAFEQFLHVKFRGKKRFSLEGAETMIPLLALLIEESGQRGVREIVIGMPHRGRLNVLVNILGKRYGAIFHAFKDEDAEDMLGRGDVKYHLGHSADITTRHGTKIHLSLTFNPSHLEAINPVVEGRVRAKQDRFGDTERERALPVLLHGDAAFPGQGIVPETLNLMNLEGYSTGGTIHIVVNNQIGFTTPPDESRSSQYCTDIAKVIEAPIFHVNGEDPEAVAQTVMIAAEFRQRFKSDVIIDMYCFRRYGHNEADEPTFTNPVMYAAVDKHPSSQRIYADHLKKQGLLNEDDMQAIALRVEDALNSELDNAGADNETALQGVWKGYVGGKDSAVERTPTKISREALEEVVTKMTTWPEDFAINRKVGRLMDKRRAILDSDEPVVDWGTAETIAYGSLLLEGARVRLSGQDSQRGTFSHRHAVLTDQESGKRYTPLGNMRPGEQAPFECINSPLSEAAVLGFEFGYALDAPDALVIWEAQFGDFANGAQIIIDQFISATEDKWDRICGLVMLLPHGFEGQGPEHSSARLERFLALCAEDCMQVVNLTTPAQIFHCLRRQVVRKWRKPLVVMSPKSLLRLRAAGSRPSELVEGHFQRVIPEGLLADTSAARRAVICSGKVYYDLLSRRDVTGDTSTALIRLEQMYPFPADEIREAVDALGGVDEVVWCQEEPMNMGAFYFLHHRMTALFDGVAPLRWVTRPASASPATGSAKAHVIEQEALLDRVYQSK